MADGYMGNLYLTKSCRCKEKNKDNWVIMGVSKSTNPSYIVKCEKCKNQWRTRAKYTKDLRRAGWLK